MKKHILMTGLMILLSLSIVSAISITDVESFPQEITPGETAKISIEIENTLNMDVSNVNVGLDLSEVPEVPFAPYQSSSERFIEELDEGEDETFEFEVIVLPTTSSGIYMIPVKITYFYEENEETKSGLSEGLISLIVNSEVELKIFSEDSILIREAEGSLSIKIVNSGLSDIKFAYLIMGSVAGIQFVSDKEQYIGDISSDDFDDVEYKVYVSAGAPSLISLPVTLKYRDATNKEFEEQKEITLRVYSLKEAQEKGLIEKPNYFIFVGISSVVLLYILYRVRKKRKLKAKK
jgi:hypothetical protein